MRHGLLVLLCLLAVTWFEYQIYPGHTYLQGETQLLVPMLERLDAPAFLSRDLVASNPVFAATIYDELTGSLHADAHLPFRKALEYQQILFRFAAVLGIYLLARALLVRRLVAVLLTTAVNAVTFLAAPHAYLTNPEPTPTAFAVPLVLLATGLLARRQILLSSVCGGLALLYDPLTAAVYCFVLMFIWIRHRPSRKLLNPAWLSLLIFGLIFGNLVQLQSGLGDSNDLFSRLRPSLLQIIKLRTPWVWLPAWIQPAMWNYLFLFVAGNWAALRLKLRLSRLPFLTASALTSLGMVSAAVALALLSQPVGLSAAMPPARNLSLTVAASLTLCGAASYLAATRRRWHESSLFAAIVIAALANPQVLDVFHLRFDGISRPRQPSADSVALADWAQSTWGSSMFQFADAGKADDPAIFRALSKRALWSDWESGLIADYSASAGQEWWSRWQTSMQRGFSIGCLSAMLPRPIDYFVLRKQHELQGIKIVYANSTYVVYDALDLREAPSLHFKR